MSFCKLICSAIFIASYLTAQSSDVFVGKVYKNRAPLQPNAYNPLPLGAIEPQGWLHRQLEIQASGLTGHLDEFWKDVGPNSGWLGGTGESWERGPYYLDGLLPLAYQLHNRALIEKAKKWVDWTLTHQQPDGQIGPASNDDWWPRMVMLKVLTQYQEASGDSRVIPLMTKYFAYERKELPARPLRDWGKYRWQDNAWSVIWLYNRTDDKNLLPLIKLLHDQGYNWQDQFAHFKYTEKTTKAILGPPHQGAPPDAAMQTHGVNNAMALKAAPVWWLMTGNGADRRALDHQLMTLDKYHGLPNGMFSGDEHLAGIDPSQGIELCAVVETMFSLEEDFAVLGDGRLGDRLERVTYNALPGTISDDMWSHQYDQQPNQIACTRAPRQWSTNGNDSNLFGLEPNFGCCTANLHQGWPKFVSSLWMATPDAGLVALAYAPNRVHTKIGNTDVAIIEQTDYPFHGTVHFTVESSHPATFPLQLRVPGWAENGTVSVNGQKSELPKNFATLRRTWKNGDTVELTFSVPPRVTHWYHNAAVFERGALVFSLPLQAKWDELKGHAEKSADWQLNPSVPWNYAVRLGPCDSKVSEQAVTATVPFNVKDPAVVLQINARQLPQWMVKENSAGPVPLSPVQSKERLQTLTLVPYGSAKLRMTAFPYLNEKSVCSTSASLSRY